MISQQKFPPRVVPCNSYDFVTSTFNEVPNANLICSVSKVEICMLISIWKTSLIYVSNVPLLHSSVFIPGSGVLLCIVPASSLLLVVSFMLDLSYSEEEKSSTMEMWECATFSKSCHLLSLRKGLRWIFATTRHTLITEGHIPYIFSTQRTFLKRLEFSKSRRVYRKIKLMLELV